MRGRHLRYDRSYGYDATGNPVSASLRGTNGSLPGQVIVFSDNDRLDVRLGPRAGVAYPVRGLHPERVDVPPLAGERASSLLRVREPAGPRAVVDRLFDIV